ncbi:methyltransferase domain-containing protein [Streptomyces rapamycinicus]|uniref:Protein-L-isoaspartate O-methyltransferase n=2 Tax=Streptomyces rapamycinicus TaxID=1226757 RepID=A0A3L8RPF1_STRRN|nr:methyltransferase domain-containing protein [Streptomyces rapamycinicus]MBB4783655.1 protein-L-isoaspartate(D-aspartate) O-methyltransferase [Streptomyces rapamycinicus]RLV80873.1 hypothetical protein D3C57_120850 [Streptomyces rapamycinicus NRRL 5491]UTO64028.1 methyltransferase domain-containing protein [Streptomyces rapamycinicus]UTP31981.1 methyltransferase domain-containing protein [Streptomyces rapamycinicus NRRL 5491]
MTDPGGLHARAAETLDIHEPWIRRAFEAVPRHEFVPGTVWVVDGGVYRPLRREDDPDRWARMVYDPAQAIATQVDDGAPAPAGGHVPTSSISAPAAVVTMLAELDLRPGHRVLEIGAGTGYNAALLAERVGVERVTTLEIDPDVADGARAGPHRAGYGGVTVLEADGERGWRGGAPYDRLVATASVTTIPWAWAEQVRPGGLILAPFRTAFCSHGLARLTVSDSRAEGRFAGAVTFMAVRGQRARPRIDAGGAASVGCGAARALRAIEQRGRGWGRRVDRRPPGRWERPPVAASVCGGEARCRTSRPRRRRRGYLSRKPLTR